MTAGPYGAGSLNSLKIALGDIRMRSLTSALVVAAAIVAARSKQGNAAEPTAKITAYGRYGVTITALKPTSQKVSGRVTAESKDQQHLETTKTIPCKTGETFGITVEVKGLQPGRTYRWREETLHPPIKQPTGEVMTKSVAQSKLVPDKPELTRTSLWSFVKGYEFELVPGTYTRKIYLDDKEVASMSFHVVKSDTPTKNRGL
jgi:hypothetical protein